MEDIKDYVAHIDFDVLLPAEDLKDGMIVIADNPYCRNDLFAQWYTVSNVKIVYETIRNSYDVSYKKVVTMICNFPDGTMRATQTDAHVYYIVKKDSLPGAGGLDLPVTEG